MDLLNESLAAGSAICAKPRRCAQRLIVTPEFAAGVQPAVAQTSPTMVPCADGDAVAEIKLAPVAPCPLPPIGRFAPRCLAKIGPKPTELVVPQACVPSQKPPPVGTPQRSREEKDAKHKLVLLLWESFRYQRRQMMSLYSSNTSAASSCRSIRSAASNYTSGGNTPVAKHHSPAISTSPLAHTTGGVLANCNAINGGEVSNSSTNFQNQTLLTKPHITVSPAISPKAGGAKLLNATKRSLFFPPAGSQAAADDGGAHAEGGEEALLVPKPSTLPCERDPGVPTLMPNFSTDFTLPFGAHHPTPAAASHGSTTTNTASTGGADRGILFDDVDEENRLLQQSVDAMAAQWKAMVKQLDDVWNHIDGDVETKYHKIKIRITSMLLWERLDAPRSMLSPPLSAIRQMNDEHERRLATIPKGRLFHDSPMPSPTSATSPSSSLMGLAMLTVPSSLPQSQNQHYLSASGSGAGNPAINPLSHESSAPSSSVGAENADAAAAKSDFRLSPPLVNLTMIDGKRIVVPSDRVTISGEM